MRCTPGEARRSLESEETVATGEDEGRVLVSLPAPFTPTVLLVKVGWDAVVVGGATAMEVRTKEDVRLSFLSRRAFLSVQTGEKWRGDVAIAMVRFWHSPVRDKDGEQERMALGIWRTTQGVEVV